MRKLAVLLMLVPMGLAGCVGTEDDVGPQSVADTLPVEAILDGVVVDAASTVSALAAFVRAHPNRNSGLPDHVSARDALESGLKHAGLEVIRQDFADPTRVPIAGVDGPAVQLTNIIGIKWGTTAPNEWIVIGGHYDTVIAAVQGAYDDGSGTMQTVGLAHALKDVALDRTVAFVLFDGEERGLRGSKYMADSMTDFYDDLNSEPFPYSTDLVAMIDLDMIGINHPAPPPIVFDENSKEIREFVLARATALGIPQGKIECRGITAGRSDYASFEDAGVPVAFFISDFDDVWFQQFNVPRTYPFWHQMDTVETMELMAGGRAQLVAGFQTSMDLAGGLLVHLATDTRSLLTVQTDEEAPAPRC